MKRLLSFLLLLVLLSCKKDKNTNSLIGKWQLIEVYQGYSSSTGGCLCWVAVPSSNADELEFFITGKYKLTKSLLSSATGCSGSYRVMTDSTINLTFDCHTDPSIVETHKYSKTLTELIIDNPFPGGYFRHKYRRK